MSRSDAKSQLSAVAVLLVILALLAGFAWSRYRSVQPGIVPGNSYEKVSTKKDQQNDPAPLNKSGVESSSKQLGTLVLSRLKTSDRNNPEEFSGIDLKQTSWENPFQQEYWIAEGWTFDDEFMSCPGGDILSATFRRPYRKAMLEFEIEPTETRCGFQILLTAKDSDVATVINFGTENTVVAEVTENVQTEIDRADFDLHILPGKSNHVRLAATGNRIVISWNGQRILSCNQTVLHSTTGFRLTIASRGESLQITRMRIEGE